MRLVAAFASSVLLLLAATAATAVHAAAIPGPSAFLKLDIGADRVLADYRQIRGYFAELDRRSPRVQMENLGRTTLGEDLVMAVISSDANMSNLPRLKEIARKLADPRGLSDGELTALVSEGRTFLLITCNIHSTEIGSSQMVLELVHRLATEDSPFVRNILDNVIFLLVPSLNPDGQIIVTDWYNKNLGTPYEYSSIPELYHKYTCLL